MSGVVQFTTEEQCENAIEWIEALAHSDFPKAERRMKEERGGMCCLGVARELNNTGGTCPIYPDLHELPTGLLNERGLYGLKEIPFYDDSFADSSKNLSKMNDRGVSHPRIAKQILTEPDKYFKPAVADAVKRYFWLREEV